MKILKKAGPAILAFLMVISLFSGCKIKTEANSTSSSGAPVTIKLFANWTSTVETAPDLAWQDAVEKACNVKIQWTIPPNSAYADRLQVMLAGGDYPDAVLFPDPTASYLLDAVNSGIIVPITKQINNSPNIKNDSYPMELAQMQFKSDSGDKNYYAVPRTSMLRAEGFMVRKDWCDKVGFTIPVDSKGISLLTIDQFKDLLTKFTFNDPDGDGKNNTWGWSGNYSFTTGLDTIMSYAFGDKNWQKVTGETYEYAAPKYDQKSNIYKNALQFNADLWKAGVLDPNSPTMNDSQAFDAFNSGKIGCRVANGGNFTYLTNMQKVNPKAQLAFISGIKDAQGNFSECGIGNGTWGCWGVTSACKNVDAVVHFFDYLLSDAGWPLCKWGVLNSSYTVGAGGTKNATADYPNFLWGKSIVRRSNDPSFFTALSIANIQPMVTGATDLVAQVNSYWAFAVKSYSPSLDYGYIPPQATDPKMLDYASKMTTGISQIITGKQPVSYYDTLLAGWYAAGGTTYMQQMNTHIKKVLAK